MRIVTDTNVLISATFWYGDSFRILELVEKGKIKLILSPEILDEYTKVLQYEEIQEKIRDKHLNILLTVGKIAELAEIIILQSTHKLIRDSDDDKFINCAMDGKAEWIISKDEDLLALKEFQGIKIIKPEEFLKMIQENEQSENQ